MRFMECYVREEGLVWIIFYVFGYPVHSFLSNDLAAKASAYTYIFSVTDKIFRILMAWSGIILSCEPMIKSKVTGLRLFFLIKDSITVPLACHACCVSSFFQHGRHSEFVFAHMHSIASRYPIIDSCPVRCSARHEPNA